MLFDHSQTIFSNLTNSNWLFRCHIFFTNIRAKLQYSRKEISFISFSFTLLSFYLLYFGSKEWNKNEIIIKNSNNNNQKIQKVIYIWKKQRHNF